MRQLSDHNKKTAARRQSFVHTEIIETDRGWGFDHPTEMVKENHMSDLCCFTSTNEHRCLVQSVSTHEYTREPLTLSSAQFDSAVASEALITLATCFGEINPPGY